MKKHGLPRDKPDIAAKGLFVNLSQSIKRSPWCIGMGALHRNAAWYSYEHDTVVSGAACCRLLGWPNTYMPQAQCNSEEISKKFT